MRSWLALVLVAASSGLACARSSSEAPVAAARPMAAPAAAGATTSAAPAQPAARRQPVSPMKQDTVRKAEVAALLAALQGRENEPAGTVFKNVKLHQSMPVKEFLTMMDEQYGRGLGFTCSNCHLDNKDYASDERKNKVIARQMEKMQRDIDAKYIAKVKELDDPRPKTTCVMCHRGVTHMPNTMDVPSAPPPQRKR